MASPEPVAGRADLDATRFEIPLAALAAAGAFSALFVLPAIGALGLPLLSLASPLGAPLAAVPVVRLAHRRGMVTGVLGVLARGRDRARPGLGDRRSRRGPGRRLSRGGRDGASDGHRGVPPGRRRPVALLPRPVPRRRRIPGGGVRGLGRRLRALGRHTGRRVVRGGHPAGRRVLSAVGRGRRVRRGHAGDARSRARARPAATSGESSARSGSSAGRSPSTPARPAPGRLRRRRRRASRPCGSRPRSWAFSWPRARLSGSCRGRPDASPGNLLLPLLALFFVAGLSIICHFFRRWLRSRILRAGLYALAAYFPINVGVALLGLFDWYVDFRRRGGEGTEKT